MPKAPPAPLVRHRNLPLLLLQGREAVIARFRPILNEAGLTEQQWRVLRALLEQGPMEPREIVARCSISSPSLTGVLARMDEMGLVQRERLDHDQRRLSVQATPAARRIAARMAPRIEAAYAALEQQLGAAFLKQLHHTLDALLAALGPAEAEAEETPLSRASRPAAPASRRPAAARRSPA